MNLSTWIGVAVGIIGAIIGITGWLSGRDKKLTNDGEWKGSVNTKLDDIKSSVAGTNTQLDRLSGAISIHEKRITEVESSAKQAHKRIDRLDKIVDEKN